MNLEFKNKENIYLSPYTPTTIAFEKYLKDNFNIIISGYIDIEKQGNNIYNPVKIKNLSVYQIYIVSPNWGNNIYNNLLKYIHKTKLIIVQKNANNYKKSILNFKYIRIIDKILMKIINNILGYFKFKIVKLWTNRIGEFCLENEAFLYKVKNYKSYQDKNFIVLSYLHEKDLANKTLYNLYRNVFQKYRNIYIFENNFINKYLQYLLTNKFIHKKYICDIGQRSNAYELFINKRPIIEFKKQEIVKGKNILQKLNIKKPFVCIFARDSQYLDTNFKYHDWSYHDYRDADINTYELAIKYLIEKGYSIIRLGSVVKQELTFKHPQCVDYPYSDFQSDFMDIFLVSQCEFAIGGHSGMLDICNAFSKPRIGVNHIPIDAPSYSTKNDIYIPKKIILDKNYISLKKYLELMQNSSLSYFKQKTYEKLNLKIENNTPLEILMVVKEYLNDYKYTENDKYNLERYYKIHSKSKQFSNVKTKIGTQFLRDNPWFLDD